MAAPDHISQLRMGEQTWNSWRLHSPNLSPDLSQVNLSYILKQLDLHASFQLDLSNANLSNCTLSYSFLEGTNFDAADLSGADLSYSNLSSASFGDAILVGTSLIGADLTGVRNLTQEQLDVAYGDHSTILPVGFSFPDAWSEAFEEASGSYQDGYNDPHYFSLFSSDPYRILGLDNTASEKEIRKAYLGLVKKYHPDLNPDGPQDVIKNINWAYEMLTDPAFQEQFKAQHNDNIQPDEQESPTQDHQDHEGFDFETSEPKTWFGPLMGGIAIVVPCFILAAFIMWGDFSLSPKHKGANPLADFDAREQERKQKSITFQLALIKLGKRHRDTLDWKRADRLNTKQAVQEYLTHRPNGLHIKRAQIKLVAIRQEEFRAADQNAWTNALRVNSKLSFESYLKTYPKGNYIKQARVHIGHLVKAEELRKSDLIAWEKAAKTNSRNAFQSYLRRFPNGQYADQAEDRVASLIRKENLAREDRAWQSAIAENTATSFKTYKDNFPKGRYVEKANNLMAALVEEQEKNADLAAWQNAVKVNTVDAIKNYKNKFPNGRYSKEAELHLSTFKTLAEKEKDDRQAGDVQTNVEAVKQTEGHKPKKSDTADEVLSSPLL